MSRSTRPNRYALWMGVALGVCVLAGDCFLDGPGHPLTRAVELFAEDTPVPQAVAPTGAFPKPFDTEPASSGQPLDPQMAVEKWRLPPGFRATVFAAEPDVLNPIACAWDHRGRLWVCENHTYAERTVRFEAGLRDRVLIFDDTDGDGRHDSRKVFTDDVQYLSSVTHGVGGVFLMAPPHLLFVPDRNADDKPDGPPEVLLDGFEIARENYHTFANGLKWGPDGWLYGRCGASCPAEVGIPGTAPENRIPVRGGIWRYHPLRKVFEAICHGTTNPWGHDWTATGEGVFINTVNGHLWHMIAGAHLRRPHTIEPNPWVFEPLEMHADHWHFDTGKGWAINKDSPLSDHDALGGGHAHIGCLIYDGNNWPPYYRGKLLTCNLHGRRVNVERLQRSRSGLVAKHEPDILYSADPWFRGMELTEGPDGGVYVLDWSDAGECHEHNGVHRNSGRIYKITYGQPAPPPVRDVTGLPVSELVELAVEANGWAGRTARRELVDRQVRFKTTGQGESLAAVVATQSALLDDWAEQHLTPDRIVPLLRRMWIVHTLTESLPVEQRFDWMSLTVSPPEAVRTWALRLATDDWPLDTIFSRRPGGRDEVDASRLNPVLHGSMLERSGLGRLALATVMQRIPVSERWLLASNLFEKPEDADDPNLPGLVWTALVPVAESDPLELVHLATPFTWPIINEWIARRLASEPQRFAEALSQLIEQAVETADHTFAESIARGLAAGFKGQRRVPAPGSWSRFVELFGTAGSESFTRTVQELSVVFGDGRALDEVRQIALDGQADLNARRAALETLVEQQDEQLRKVCEEVLKVRFLNATALRGLATIDDDSIGQNLARNYRSFHQADRPAVLATLVARPGFAAALLDELAASRIPRGEISVEHARQIRALENDTLSKRLAEIWGELRDSPADKLALRQKWEKLLTPTALAAANPSRGRAHFNRVCAACHLLYGHGQSLGPDLTGSGRRDLGYLLDNLIDPGAVLAADYRLHVAELKDGRVVSGLVVARTPQTVTLRNAQEKLVLPTTDIEELKSTPQSLMPDGLLAESLKEDEVRDLVAYLMSPSQVPLADEPSESR